jgi:ATP-binding cassette, subfamily B, bacterial MsbA
MRLRVDSRVVGVYRRLLGYLKPHWRMVAAGVAATVLHAGADALLPFIMMSVIEHLQTGVREGGAVIPLLLILVAVVRGGTDFFAVFGLGWVGRSVIRDLRTQLFTHYLDLPVRYYDQSSSGALISKLTYNTEQVAEAISTAIVTVVRDSLTMIALVGVMIYMSPELTLLIAIVGPTVGLLVNAMSRAFRRYSSRIQNSMGDVTRVTEQSLLGQRIVKIFQGQDYERRQFDDINRRNFRLNVRLVATRAAGDSLTQGVVALGVAAVVFVAFSDWMLEDLGPAVFIGFLTAMAQLLSPLKRLININVSLQKGIAAADSLFETLDEPIEEDVGGHSVERVSGEIEYRNVSFSYDPAKGPVLRDVSLRVPPGSVVALVGRSGSGKSTLVNLLPRFYEFTQGSILLDGTDIREYRLRDLRRQISLVSQDIVLFDDTIANNVAYGSLSTCSREQVEEAAEAAYVAEFAAELPAGLDTPVGERGVLLSGGQRQRVAIARALLKNAPVLILDEATSALDTESERRIQEALGKLMQGRTTLVIAHRLSTVENADLIVVLKDGTIVERGTHAELISRRGYYQALHSMQFPE